MALFVFKLKSRRFSHAFSESLTSVCVGHVANPDYPEVVCCTYAGCVAGLTTEPKPLGDIQQTGNSYIDVERLMDEVGR